VNFIYPDLRVALPTLTRACEQPPLKRAASPRARRQGLVNKASDPRAPGRDGAVPAPGLMRRPLPCRMSRRISTAFGRGPWSLTSSRCMPLTLLWVDRFSSPVPGSTACATELRIGRYHLPLTSPPEWRRLISLPTSGLKDHHLSPTCSPPAEHQASSCSLCADLKWCLITAEFMGVVLFFFLCATMELSLDIPGRYSPFFAEIPGARMGV
jgi:hypothetical protein